MIEKTYLYGPGEAGVEDIDSLEDFILYHIQDDEVGLMEAGKLAQGQEVRNEEIGVMVEIYHPTDAEAIREALNSYLRDRT